MPVSKRVEMFSIEKFSSYKRIKNVQNSKYSTIISPKTDR
jgi:hypothetical protein